MVHYIDVHTSLMYASFVDSEFYDDFISVYKYNSEAPLVHSTPATMV